jgi:hypothetical protein
MEDVTDDFIRLSVTAGYIAAGVDHYLGRDHFESRIRKIRFDMTWEVVEQMIAEARKLGVPREHYTLPPALKAKLKDRAFLQRARELQRASDRRWMAARQ